jgi:hypothetical protein
VPGPSEPKTFEDYLRAVMGAGVVSTRVGLYSRGYGIVLVLPGADGTGGEFSVEGNMVTPLTEPKPKGG